MNDSMNNNINNNNNNNEPVEVELGYNRFFYLFPLLGLILVSIGIIASVWNLITSFKTDYFFDYMVVLIGTMPIMGIMFYVCLKLFIKGVKSKIEYNKNIKSGKFKKPRPTIISITFALFVIGFLSFMMFGVIGLILQENGHPMKPEFVEMAIKIIFGLTLGIGLLCDLAYIVSMLIGFLKKHILK